MADEALRKKFLYHLRIAIGRIELRHDLTKQYFDYTFLKENISKFPEFADTFEKRVKEKIEN